MFAFSCATAWRIAVTYTQTTQAHYEATERWTSIHCFHNIERVVGLSNPSHTKIVYNFDITREQFVQASDQEVNAAVVAQNVPQFACE